VSHEKKKRTGQTGIERNSIKRNKRFEIRLTSEEWEALQKRAIESGNSSTALFARSILLPQSHTQNQESKTEHKLRLALLASLGKIGSNINQIARALNRMQIWNDTVEQMLIELVKVQEGIKTIKELFKDRK
jgi:hypothetical protein